MLRWIPISLLAMACNTAPRTPDGEEFIDADGDGYFVNDPVAARQDCDDGNAAVYPSAVEICDGADNDCNGLRDDEAEGAQIFYPDDDRDGFGKRTDEPLLACQQPLGYSLERTDCNDDDADVYPGAPERCNDKDDDCDLEIDEGFDPELQWYADVDRDGFGGTAVGQGCPLDPSWVITSEDCNDINARIRPDAPEICDGIDNDCDGIVDANDPDVVGTRTWYRDADGDTYGTLLQTTQVCAGRTPGNGWVDNSLDCNDADPLQNPDATWYRDADRDGFGTSNAAPWPTSQCWQPFGYSLVTGDCDDTDPEAWEVRVWFADADLDGFGSPFAVVQGCGYQVGMVADASDCDDRDPLVNPAGTEICNGGIDDDCDGAADDDDDDTLGKTIWYGDEDGDGYGVYWLRGLFCDDPGGFAPELGDCDDEDAEVNPATIWYRDADRDGYGDPTAPAGAPSCEVVPGHAPNDGDCDDADYWYNGGTPWWPDRDRDGVGTGIDPTRFGCLEGVPRVARIPGDCDDADSSNTDDHCFGPQIGTVQARIEVDADPNGVLVVLDCQGVGQQARALNTGDANGVVWLEDLDLDPGTICKVSASGPSFDATGDGLIRASVRMCGNEIALLDPVSYPADTPPFFVNACSGCMDPTASNYDPRVEIENPDSCIYVPYEGAGQLGQP